MSALAASPSSPSPPPARSVLARLREGGRPLAALLLFGALFKLLVMAAALDGDPLLRHPTSDARYYLDRARGLAGLTDDPLASQVHHLPPLYPHFLARIPGAVEGRFAGVLAVQHLAGLGVVLATYLLARRRAGVTGALVAAALTLAYAPLTFFETRLLGDSLATAALVFALLVCDGLASLAPRHGERDDDEPGDHEGEGSTTTVEEALPPGDAQHAQPQRDDVQRDNRRPQPRPDDAHRDAQRAQPQRDDAHRDDRRERAWRLPATRDGAPAGAWPGRWSGIWRGVVLGALLGTACLLRPQALLLAPVLALWAFRRRRLAGLCCALTVALCLLPSARHNLRAGGDLVLVSDNGGINLWLAATGPRSGTFRIDDETFGDIARQADESRRRAEAEAGRPLTPGQVSRHWTRAALAAAVADPVDQLVRVGLRARALLESFETGIVAFPELAPTVMPPLVVAALPFGLLLALWGAARVLLAGRPRTAPALPALALGVMVVLTALVFFHYSRFRLPLVPLMAVTVGRGVHEVLRRRPAASRLALALLAAGALASVSWLPPPHRASTLANGFTSLAEARRAGSSPSDRELLQRARADLDRALEADSGFVRAQLLAAELDLVLGNWDGCDRWLLRLERVLPDHPQVLAARGILSASTARGNRHADRARAEAVLVRLRLAQNLDPSLTPVVETLSAMLGGG